MKRHSISLAFLLFFSFSNVFAQIFDIQGHRGCRGLMPENSIPGFLKAIDLGVTTIEMDVVVSADGKIVVSHDPYISAQFCVNELGMEINKKEEQGINIYNLMYQDVQLFDCGIKGNKDFPEQQKLSVYKPLLSEVIETCEAHIQDHNKKPVRYNIELKSSPSGDHVFHPEPNLFTELVYNVLEGSLPKDRVCIQSFDLRILHYWKMKYPDYTISFLISNSKSPTKNIEELGFIPDIYSPNYKLVNKKEVDELHGQSMKVIPWTVNEIKEMEKMIEMGVDGLITDYPDRYISNFTAAQ